MDTEDWCGLVVRTRARLPFGVAVGLFTYGPHAGRLRVHGPYRFGRGTQAEWQGTLVYAVPPAGPVAGVTASGVEQWTIKTRRGTLMRISPTRWS